MRKSPTTRLQLEELEHREVPSAGFQTLPVLPIYDQAVLDNARAIATIGRSLGRDTDVFMKVGDSNSSYINGYGTGYLYTLGQYGYSPVTSGLATINPALDGTLASFQSVIPGTFSNSFNESSLSAVPGVITSFAVATGPQELARTNAGIALIMIGTNDVVHGTSLTTYQSELEQIVQYFVSQGVVPVLSTLPPDLYDGGAFANSVAGFNQVIADVAAEYDVPLWNLNRELSTLPNDGLDAYGLHLDSSPNGSGSFIGGDLLFGQNVRNLEALQILNWYQTQVASTAPAPYTLSSSWTPLTAGETVYAVGRDAGQAPVVSIYDATTNQLLDTFLAYDPSFSGGVRVAVADVTGSGVPDIIVAPGVTGGPDVKVFSGVDGSLISSFFAFSPNFRGGVSIAAGDLDGSGKADIVVGAGIGGGPEVEVFNGDGTLQESFFAFNSSLRTGVNVAVGNFAGVGPGIAVGAGVGGGPVIEIFAYGSDHPAQTYLIGDSSARGGAYIAAGSLDGSGFDNLIVAPVEGPPVVQVFDTSSDSIIEQLTYGDGSTRTGVHIAAITPTPGASAWLLVGNASGATTGFARYVGLTNSGTTIFSDDTRSYGLFPA